MNVNEDFPFLPLSLLSQGVKFNFGLVKCDKDFEFTSMFVCVCV